MFKRTQGSMSLLNVPLSTANLVHHLAVAALIGGLALVLISIVSLVWSGMVRERYAADRLTQNEAAIAAANLALQKARDQAADATKLLTQAKVAAATLEQEKEAASDSIMPLDSRSITPEKREMFKSYVKGLSKGRVLVGWVESDPEAVSFAKQLSDLLAEAGYQVVAKAGPTIPIEDNTGIHIRIRSMAAQPAYAGSLQKGLEYIGIDTSGELDDAAEDSVLILVGSKP